MTNSEYREKYPIGTKIKWVLPMRYANSLAKKDIGKTGTIVGFGNDDCPYIFLPESEHRSLNSTQIIPISWHSGWKVIEILSQKNKQLEFSFMQQS